MKATSQIKGKPRRKTVQSKLNRKESHQALEHAKAIIEQVEGPKDSIEESQAVSTNENSVQSQGYPSLREVIRSRNAQRQKRRQRAAELAEHAAAKVPEWAQTVWRLQQAHDLFLRLYLETIRFAESKGFELTKSDIAGYDLRRDRKPVLRGRPMFTVVEYLAAQDLWMNAAQAANLRITQGPPK